MRGLYVAKKATWFEVWKCFGRECAMTAAVSAGAAAGICNRDDHGNQDMSDDYQAGSPSRHGVFVVVRGQPECNAASTG